MCVSLHSCRPIRYQRDTSQREAYGDDHSGHFLGVQWHLPCVTHHASSKTRCLLDECPVKLLVARLCLTLCHPMDCSLPGSSVHGTSQASMLEWVVVSFSLGSSWPRDQTLLSWVSCIAGRFFTIWVIRESQNTGVGCQALLQGIVPTQGLNPGLPKCRWILYQLSHKESPRILEWLTYPFSRGSSRPRNWTEVSCITGGLFTNWATREAQMNVLRWGN